MRILFPLSFILIAGLLGFFVVSPLYANISELRTEVEAYNVALKSSSDLKNTRDSLIDVYKKIKQDDKDRLAHLIPSSMSNLEFILEVEKLASSHNMSINNIEFEKKEIKKPAENKNMVIIEDDTNEEERTYGTFPIEFETEGTYSDFILFLKDLEFNLRLTDITSASFATQKPGIKTEEGKDPNVHLYKIKAETYWLK